jgi:hypothetical protein
MISNNKKEALIYIYIYPFNIYIILLMQLLGVRERYLIENILFTKYENGSSKLLKTRRTKDKYMGDGFLFFINLFLI